MTNKNKETFRIAVIRLGSLGDFVQAMGPFKSIRRHHPDAHITLITTKPFAELGRDSAYFDDVWTDGRPNWLSTDMVRLLRRFRQAKFDFIYDLQTSNRTSWYYQLLRPHQPRWSGVARGCSHPHDNPNRIPMHTVDRQSEQLHKAGIKNVLKWDLSWAQADISAFHLPTPYALLVPGGSPHRPAKRWPVAQYTELATHLASQSITPVLLGAEAERTELEAIEKNVPAAINLCGETSFLQIIALGRTARVAIGNDTGPMHLLAGSGAPCLILFSHESDPDRCAPRGPLISILRRLSLLELPTDEVTQQLHRMSVLA